MQAMKRDPALDMSLGAQILTELRECRDTLRRICWEKDLLLAAVRDLLHHQGLHASATRLSDAIEQLYQERSEAAAARREMQERDTIPPEAP